MNPCLSAYAQLHGAFDFNQTPLELPGTRVFVYENSYARKTWVPHGVDGCYLGPAPEHYHCYRTWIWATEAKRIGDTVDFFPRHIKMLATYSAEKETVAAEDLVNTLLNPAPASPFAERGDGKIMALKALANIFKRVTPMAAPAEPATPDSVRPAQRVPRVDMPGEARH